MTSGIGGFRDDWPPAPGDGEQIEAGVRGENLALEVGHRPGIADQKTLRMRGVLGAGISGETALRELAGFKCGQVRDEAVAGRERSLRREGAVVIEECLEHVGNVDRRLDESTYRQV